MIECVAKALDYLWLESVYLYAQCSVLQIEIVKLLDLKKTYCVYVTDIFRVLYNLAWKFQFGRVYCQDDKYLNKY